MNEYPLTEILLIGLLVCVSLGYLARKIWSAVRALSQPQTGSSNCNACGGCPAGKRNPETTQ